MPIQPPTAAFQASAWLPTARTRFFSPSARALLPPFRPVNMTNRTMPAEFSAGATEAGASSPNNQTWQPTSGIVFGSSPESRTSERQWTSAQGDAFTRVSPHPRGPSPPGRQQARHLHSEIEEQALRRPTRPRKAKSGSSRALSHCASVEASYEQGNAETAAIGVIQSKSLDSSYASGSVSYSSSAMGRTVEEDVLKATTAGPEASSDNHKGTTLATEHETELPSAWDHESEFRLQDEVFQEARRNGDYWEFGLYRNADGIKPKMQYCRTREASEKVALEFLADGAKVVGFDLEWKSHYLQRGVRSGTSTGTIKDNVSLIQLASASRVGIFHLALHRGSTASEVLAPALRRILEAPSIVKAGVNINSDCTRLRKFLDVDVRARCELSNAHKLVTFALSDPRKVDRRLVSLDKLVEAHLGLPLYKGDVRTGAWDRELAMDQLRYAASDAYAGLRLFGVLDAKRRAIVPAPPMPLAAELRLPIRLVAEDTSAVLAVDEGVVDEDDDQDVDDVVAATATAGDEPRSEP